MFFIGMDRICNGDGEDINLRAERGKLLERSLHGLPATRENIDGGLDRLMQDLDAEEESQAYREWERKPGIFRRIGAWFADLACALMIVLHDEPTDSR